MIREIAIIDYVPNANDTIWDVRDKQSYQEGHIEFAINHPLDTITPELLSHTNNTIYVLCGGGTRAGKAASLLEQIDSKRDIVILQGGTRGAKAAGMTIVTQ